MSLVPTTYNIAKLTNASIEYKILAPDQITKDNTIVFLYGLVCNNRHWEFQLNFFLKQGYKVLLHNYRYHFGSKAHQSNLNQNCTFENITSDLEELLKHLNINKIICIGHSMGVNISLELIKRKKVNVSGQVLISGNPLDPKDTMFNSNKSHEVIPALKSILNSKPFFFEQVWKNVYKVPLVRKVVLHGGFHPKMIKDEFVKYYLKKIGELKPDVFFQLIDEMGKQGIISFLPKVEVPSLIMGGDNDTIAPISSQLIFHNLIKESIFYLIKDGSHVPQADFPKSVNEKISHFIAALQ
jgi:non-heme chloroperoxidase